MNDPHLKSRCRPLVYELAEFSPLSPLHQHLFRHQLRQIALFQSVLALVELIHLAGPVHGAELRPAHGAEGRFLVVVVGQRFVVHGARRLRVERQRELFVPVEGVTGVADGVVAVARAGAMPRDIRGMSGNFVGDDAVLHVFFIGQASVDAYAFKGIRLDDEHRSERIITRVQRTRR